MSEIYWLTRLDSFNIFCGLILTACIITIIFTGVWVLVDYDSDGDDNITIRCFKKWFKTSLIGAVISSLVLVFTPTTSEAFMIYGIGGSIDYLKKNEIAKQLPDKCVEALNLWVESLNKDKEKEGDK